MLAHCWMDGNSCGRGASGRGREILGKERSGGASWLLEDGRALELLAELLNGGGWGVCGMGKGGSGKGRTVKLLGEVVEGGRAVELLG